MKIFCKRRNIRKYAIVFLMIMGFNLFFPTVSWALTSGPSQPEVQSFEPASTTQMVDLFSGDFTYNIPLFELPGPNGGYPFNLAYHAGIGMDQEASWVGLGWNLNPGAINRQMRGLPDEFRGKNADGEDGDIITTVDDMKASTTFGLGVSAGAEFFGYEGFNASLSVFNNNYKGVGIELGGGVEIALHKSIKGKELTGGLDLNLDFSVGSQSGVGFDPSLSLSSRVKKHKEGDYWSKASIGVGYNSKVGLSQLSLGVSNSRKKQNDEKTKTRTFSTRVGGSSTLSLANPGFTPSIGQPMTNFSTHLSFKTGASFWGVFGNAAFSGFYTKQKLTYAGKERRTGAYGYLNYQYAKEDKSALLDFNREQDGMVREENPNLAIPNLTYDIYSASGQGYAGMYRPFRSDVGIIYDPYTESKSNTISAGGDVAPAFAHVGLNASLNHSKSKSGKWEENNGLSDYYKFQEKDTNDLFEPWYFKVHGEPSITPHEDLENIGSEDPVRVEIGGERKNPSAYNRLENNNLSVSPRSNEHKRGSRTNRNSAILPITISELVDDGGNEVIDLFKINYHNASGVLQKYSRQWLINDGKGHHIAGYSVLTPEGSRYIYGLPVYNEKQEEYAFSVNEIQGSVRTPIDADNSGNINYKKSGTNEFYSKKSIPEYAHSYLLTAIVGQDYVDVTGDGVTEDDLGYWVKFTYQQTSDRGSNSYKWRTPFSQAMYNAGLKTTAEDDKGSFTYGEKEVWYLKEAETKSHIAKFFLSQRRDARGASGVIQDTSDGLGAYSYKLDEILLYTKLAESESGAPLKKVFFDYSEEQDQDVPELCPQIDNGTGGKLTLKGLRFEYGNNSRGSLNPYTFEYDEANPSYDINAYDRWGNYKPGGSDPLQNQEYPYVDPYTHRDLLNQYAASWSLKKIGLPSGGTIQIDYEADDYAYVQNRQAMQMLELADPFESGNMINNDNFNTRVYFKLPQSLKASDVVDPAAEVAKYLEEDRDMLYFKLKVNLRAPEEDQFDFLGTYAEINRELGMGLEEGTSGDYEYGYFYLKQEQEGGNDYHPLLLRAWQHLRVNQPELAALFGKVNENDSEFVEALKSLGSMIPYIRQVFTGYNDYARNRDWGSEWEAGKSWVRLLDPEKKRVGGGHRVRQITYFDNWKYDNEGIYGQVYDYTTTDEEGNTISSGVATYEPLIGGDENPIHYAKKFSYNTPLISDNQLFFEYPINEGYYPGSSVGYSKVTVMSLASAAAAGIPILHNDRGNNLTLFPDGNNENFGTTGKSIHEFYTAKDFPIITDETDKDDIPYQLWVPAIPLGTITAKKLASSQGYSIITNDMHGKQKEVSHFAQSIEGQFEEYPFSYVKYNYLADTILYDDPSIELKYRRPAMILKNTFVDRGDGTISFAEDTSLPDPYYHLGQETEFFVDMREHVDESYTGGVHYNTDLLLLPFFGVTIPIPAIWPNAGKNTTQLRTTVTNKVIFKSGILESVEAYNDGSLIKTKNLRWDKLTGRVMLTQVNNNFEEPVYNLAIPAHTQYEYMGAASENLGFTFDIAGLGTVLNYDNQYDGYVLSQARLDMREGDEIVLLQNGQAVGKAVYISYAGNACRFFSQDNLPDGDYVGMVYRSARRNLLLVDAGNVTALKDPTISVGNKIYNVEITR